MPPLPSGAPRRLHTVRYSAGSVGLKAGRVPDILPTKTPGDCTPDISISPLKESTGASLHRGRCTGSSIRSLSCHTKIRRPEPPLQEEYAHHQDPDTLYGGAEISGMCAGPRKEGTRENGEKGELVKGSKLSLYEGGSFQCRVEARRFMNKLHTVLP